MGKRHSVRIPVLCYHHYPGASDHPIGAASMAERYTYIPYIGLFFIVGKLFETSSGTVKAGKKLKNGLLIVLALGFITFSAITNERVKKWENEEILFSEVIARHPASASLTLTGEITIIVIMQTRCLSMIFSKEKPISKKRHTILKAP